MVEKYGAEKCGVEAGVEKSRAGMSCNRKQALRAYCPNIHTVVVGNSFRQLPRLEDFSSETYWPSHLYCSQ
jgi:hypothetical protein